MRAKSFSIFLVRSARYGRTFEVSSAAQLALVTRADTSPELGHYELAAPTYEFIFAGKSHLTRVPLAGLRKDGSRVHWDVAQSRYSPKGAFALAVRQERARLEGADYVLFDINVLGSTCAEVKNRKTIQAYLYQARDLDTEDLETLFLMRLLRGEHTLNELSCLTGRRLSVVTVAVLRLWMKGRVVVPLETQLLQPSWTVRRNHGLH